jgi:hypothetical protein
MNGRIKKISASRDALEKHQNDAGKGLIKIQHGCPHNIDGDTGRCLRLIKKDGKAFFRCTVCNKIITITPPKPEEFKKAVEVIEDGLDYFKMQLIDTNSKEDKVLDKTATTLDLLTDCSKMYDNLAAMDGRRKKNNNNDRRRTSCVISNKSVLD